MDFGLTIKLRPPGMKNEDTLHERFKYLPIFLHLEKDSVEPVGEAVGRVDAHCGVGTRVDVIVDLGGVLSVCEHHGGITLISRKKA